MVGSLALSTQYGGLSIDYFHHFKKASDSCFLMAQFKYSLKPLHSSKTRNLSATLKIDESLSCPDLLIRIQLYRFEIKILRLRVSVLLGFILETESIQN